MAYIESFFYYWLLVLIGGIIIYAFLFVIGGMIRGILHLRHSTNEKLLSFLSIKKSLKIFVPLYIFSFGFFYIDKASDYLWGDRAYKEAKAYAIAGEYVFFLKAGLLQFVYPNNLLLQPLNKAESFVLTKIDEHIPPTDAERQIWKYKFHLIDYAGTMFAPITDESEARELDFTNPAASMKPELLKTLDEMYVAMDTLSKAPMKDKEFDRIDRYLVIASMAPYYKEYILYSAELNSDTNDRRYYEKKWEKFYGDDILKNNFLRYLAILDQTHDEMTKDKDLAQAFEEHPRIKASYYWGAVKGYVAWSNLQTDEDDVYPCKNPNFLKFVDYYKEYTDWAYRTPNSSFQSLSQREKKNYDFKIENQNNAYYIAKYICNISLEYSTMQERSIDGFNNFESLFIDRPNIVHIRNLQQKQTQGVNNGR